MIRVLVSGSLALALFLFERSFVAALPEPWMRLPLVLAAGVYLVQHLSLLDGAAWIVAAGILSDALALSPAPSGTIAGALAAVTAVLLSRRVFTNRSLWGILACGACAITVHALVSAATLAATGALRVQASGWAEPWRALPWALALGFATLWTLFRLAKRVRRLLSGALLVHREPL